MELGGRFRAVGLGFRIEGLGVWFQDFWPKSSQDPSGTSVGFRAWGLVLQGSEFTDKLTHQYCTA